MTKFHPRRQGDLGEAAAIEWLTRIGACVAFPLFHSPDHDLVADLNGNLLRVRVKTSRRICNGSGHDTVQLATSGGNQSWTGVVKTFDPARIDFLFILVGDGRRWFTPSSEIEGNRGISLGGEKNSEFQVGCAEPLDHRDSSASKLGDPRGGAGVGEPGRTVNPVAQPEWVRFPPPPPPHLRVATCFPGTLSSGPSGGRECRPIIHSRSPWRSRPPHQWRRATGFGSSRTAPVDS